ncbi:MAG: 16S rRNA (cytosine(967)-C(5))-methyltransferase RsmB [Candidatus Ancaeobacter aquaticus]|nr:16S rRNA (cytosine(967)-C(5))-methyltransferase RsmB [Candidatus Ancaeobacter aquaticus]
MSNKRGVSKTRECAVKLVERVTCSQTATVKNLLSHYMNTSGISGSDRALFTELSYGVIRHLNTIDWYIKKYSSHKNIDPYIKNVLRVGVYQLVYLDKIPHYAALNESVELAKVKSIKSGNFVNALLRKVTTSSKDISGFLKKDNYVQYLSIMYSFPEWLIVKWKSILPEKELVPFLEAMNASPEITLRVNTHKLSRDELLNRLHKLGISASAGTHPLAIRIQSSIIIDDLKEYKDGCFYVQDESTLRIVDMLDPQPGETILELCAAPGGKTTYSAQKMNNEGIIYALDNDDKRLERLKENCDRMGSCIARPICQDLLKEKKILSVDLCDRVLVDVPCSNQGVLLKRVEAKWRISQRDISRLSKVQEELLLISADYVKSCGVMVYSTCSIDTAEDEEIIKKFLAKRNDFYVEKMFKTWPHLDKIDGSFGVKLIRK